MFLNGKSIVFAAAVSLAMAALYLWSFSGYIQRSISESLRVNFNSSAIRSEHVRTNPEELLAMLPRIDTDGVDCSRVFAGDEDEIRKANRSEKVTKISDRHFLLLAKDCDRYRRRGYLLKPVNDEEERFPIAYIVQIYKDLVQIERLLRAIYRPQNWYCINVDLSSSEDTHLGMIAIASCFDNILINNVDVAWAKMSQVEADLTCMQLLYNKNRDWKYLLTLAGQMFPLKTNLDLVHILKSLNGSNAMQATMKKRNLNRWSHLPTPEASIRLVKGGCHFAVTRSFVRFVLFNKKARVFKNWTSKTFFPDEHYFQSLNHSPELKAPGSYTGWPENGVDGYTDINRYNIWSFNGGPCHGQYVRAVCIFGVADLARMSRSRAMFVNKFYYDYQPMALKCMEKRHYDWTKDDILGQSNGRINITFYSSLPNVKNHVPSGLEHYT